MDRQDIDALLISALYGELTPAEEARLTAHLESHPTDRGALDDLKLTRQTFLDSRLFAIQLDPPQAVSALLLQEAHRRAPKAVKPADEKEGWFARFARNFMAHPAMAAAAMLVLVMGGAGIVWMKKGDSQFAEQNVSQTRVSQETANNAPAAAAPQGAADTASAGSAMNADLADEQAQGELSLATDGKANDEGGASERRRAAAELEKTGEQAEGQKQKIATGRMDVNTDRAPKDLDEEKAKKEDSSDDYVGRAKAGAKPAPKGGAASADPVAPGPARGGGGAGGDLAFGGEANANAVSGAGAAAPAPTTTATPGSGSGYAQPSPPPAPKTAKVATKAPTKATTSTTTADKNAPATGGKAPAPEKKSPPAQTVTKSAAKPAESPTAPTPKTDAKESSLTAWAKSEHARAVAMANNGDCAGAAKIAVTVSNRASSYYTQFMATDRALKGCQTHIANERDKDAEKSQKARAQKRVNADEPSAPAESVK